MARDCFTVGFPVKPRPPPTEVPDEPAPPRGGRVRRSPRPLGSGTPRPGGGGGAPPALRGAAPLGAPGRSARPGSGGRALLPALRRVARRPAAAARRPGPARRSRLGGRLSGVRPRGGAARSGGVSDRAAGAAVGVPARGGPAGAFGGHLPACYSRRRSRAPPATAARRRHGPGPADHPFDGRRADAAAPSGLPLPPLGGAAEPDPETGLRRLAELPLPGSERRRIRVFALAGPEAGG